MRQNSWDKEMKVDVWCPPRNGGDFDHWNTQNGIIREQDRGGRGGGKYSSTDFCKNEQGLSEYRNGNHNSYKETEEGWNQDGEQVYPNSAQRDRSRGNGNGRGRRIFRFTERKIKDMKWAYSPRGLDAASEVNNDRKGKYWLIVDTESNYLLVRNAEEILTNTIIACQIRKTSEVFLSKREIKIHIKHKGAELDG